VSSSRFDVYRCELDGTRLIEASAGTGKTWSLSGLYLRLLLERELPVPQILVVTFTNAAVAELRERIRSRIAEMLEWLRGAGTEGGDPFVPTLLKQLRQRPGWDDKSARDRLEQALQGFDEAAILTIHGFCQRALAEAPFSTGMPLQLSLLSDDSALRQQVVNDFWRQHIAAADLPLGVAALLLQRGDTPQRLDELLKRRLAKPLAHCLWPDAQPPVDGSAREQAFTAARQCWLAEHADIEAAVREALGRLNGSSYKPETLDEACRSWHRLCAQTELPQSLEPFPRLKLLAASTLQPKKGQAPPAPHRFYALAQALLDADAAWQQAAELARLALLRTLLDQGPDALRAAKRTQRVLGFDDMLLNLHERLQGEGGDALAARLRGRFGAALIDEFQDTDPLQYAIFRRLFHGSDAPLMLVGDPKQAIYSFRGADLPTYLEARRDARAEYSLEDNQRSSGALIEALNALFGAQSNAFMIPQLAYRPVSEGVKTKPPLHEDGAAPRAALQLWQLPRDADDQPLPMAEARRLALQACAAEIARLLAAAQAGRVRLGERALRGGDIAVLVRSHAQGAAMRRALAALGVASVELSQASVFDSPDAADLERLLAAVLEPQREPLLRAALATEAMGLDAAQIDALAGDEAALLALVMRFAGYRDTWLQRGVGRMLREWMRAEGVAERLLSRPEGERRLTNLRHLAELLHEAAAEHPTPDALLRWLQAQRADPRQDDAAQLRLESDRNLVQVVTVHKSKGLEYALVFCPLLFLGTPERSPGGDALEYHDEQGDAVFDFRLLDKAEHEALKARAAEERAAETLRLIYVALTRAIHRCHLVVGPYSTRTKTGVSVKESCRARLNWLVAGEGLTPAQWLNSDATWLGPKAAPVQRITTAWERWAAAQAPQVSLQSLPLQPGQPLPPAAASGAELAALPPPWPLPQAWWIGSYSSLAHGVRHEAAAVDHDQRARDREHGDAVELPDDDVLRFERGAVAGECLHAVFEQADFGDAASWPAAVDAALQRFGPALPVADDAALRPRRLLNMLQDVLHTPLPSGGCLAEVPRQRRLVELEFHLPARQLQADALQHLLHAHGVQVPALHFGRLDGYLRGFIDLVFEQGGRYYLLDWKSNHLGDRPADYAAAPLQQAMTQQGYGLQAVLYALALQRYLQHRLPSYRHETHFGGVLYLFVRGVRPGWLQADGRPAGVHAMQPSAALLQQLSALLDGEGVGR
jgi:exodeoxyribonuclease V beta subunit